MTETVQSAGQVKLTLDGKTVEFPIIEGSEKERAIDIKKLRGETGLITLDSGFGNTGSCFSDITFIDGEQGGEGCQNSTMVTPPPPSSGVANRKWRTEG